jgi:hypothetical protein
MKLQENKNIIKSKFYKIISKNERQLSSVFGTALSPFDSFNSVLGRELSAKIPTVNTRL